MKGANRFFFSALALAALTSASFASLYSDNFDSDHTASYKVNHGPTDDHVNFFFDYSTLGIPTAPHSVGGTTRGLMLYSNTTGGVLGGPSVSPLGLSLTGDYVFKADVWMNFLGPAPAGGSGTTQVAGMGVLTNGTTAQYPGFANGIYFMTTNDGGSSADWRAYAPGHVTSYQDGDPVYYATTRNSSNTYYATKFLGDTPPAAQTALFASQTGKAQAGCIAFAWHESTITKKGNLVTWDVDGLKIATIDITTVSTGGTNISFNYSDTNNGVSTAANSFLTTAIFDNARVESVPEPGTMALLGLGVAAMARKRCKK
ncbi:MAG: PEP-CTERM sorting domain-containing protein [Armatimonadetes bacterium]|nr:PEP-CTERM sorting domain-containing protein [Armatimonadota bacterium]